MCGHSSGPDPWEAMADATVCFPTCLCLPSSVPGPAAALDSTTSQRECPGHVQSLLLPLQALRGRWTAPFHGGRCQHA